MVSDSCFDVISLYVCISCAVFLFFGIFDLPVCCLFLTRVKESVRSWGHGEVQRSGGGGDLEGAAVRDCGQNIFVSMISTVQR